MGKEVKEVDKDAMLEYVQKSGGQIIKRKGGIQGKVPMRMNKKEIEQLHKSADALKAVIAQIDLD